MREYRPASRYSCLSRAMFSNGALRSGCRAPIALTLRALRFTYPCRLNNCLTTPSPAGVPRSPSRWDISRRVRSVHWTPSRIGSPAVWSRNTSRKFCSSCGQMSIRRRRPPFFFEPGPPPDPPVAPTPPAPAGSSWGRSPELEPCTRRRHAPVWPPPPLRIAGDPSPTASRKTVSWLSRFPRCKAACRPP